MDVNRLLAYVPGTHQYTVRQGLKFAEKFVKKEPPIHSETEIESHRERSSEAFARLTVCAHTPGKCSIKNMRHFADQISPALSTTTSVGKMIDLTGRFECD